MNDEAGVQDPVAVREMRMTDGVSALLGELLAFSAQVDRAKSTERVIQSHVELSEPVDQ